MLTITDPLPPDIIISDSREKKTLRKRVVLVMARQQPGESPASLIVQVNKET